MLSRLRAIVLLMAISNLWTSCQGQMSTSDYTTSHPNSVQSIAIETSTTFPTTDGLSSTTSTSSVPFGSSATVTTSPTVNSLSSTVIPPNTLNTDITTSKNEINLTTPASSTSQNSAVSHSPLTTTYTPLNGSSTMAPETSTIVNTTTANVSFTNGSPENNTSENVSTTSKSTLSTDNTTTLSVATDFTTDTSSTSFSTNSTSQAPSSEVTPSNKVSTSSTGTSMTLTTGYLATTNQSEWSGNSKDIESNTGVVLGAIFGSLLGVVLVCVAAYFLCGSKKTSNFSHRRLYEETANDPVLRLDNPADLYDATSGNSAYYNPSAIEEPSYHSGRPHETIVMDDIRPR